jgi:adenine deaminase
MVERYEGLIVDVVAGTQFAGQIAVKDGRIASVTPGEFPTGKVIMPGFIDAHVHVESSMLVPREFARLALPHGTVGSVSDPHEIANVLGVEGVEFMIENARGVPFRFCFGAPSCVPATSFETSGARLDSRAVAQLLARPEVGYLSEVMNYPGVLAGDRELLAMIAAARAVGKPVDGHAPGVRGVDAQRYVAAGISTDHECTTFEEAIEKARLGMKILIREGSAAKNFAALLPLLVRYPEQVMFCSDDLHPNDLVRGHLNLIAARAVRSGSPLMPLLRALTLNPVRHYQLSAGLLQVGDPADFIIVRDLQSFEVEETYIAGSCVAKNGRALFPSQRSAVPNQFCRYSIREADVAVPDRGADIRVIVTQDGQLVTSEALVRPRVNNGLIEGDTDRDLLKIVVVNRYQRAPVSVGFVSGIGLLQGAIASTVAHDSHNIIAVGTSDATIVAAVNALMESSGGVCAVLGEQSIDGFPSHGVALLSLPVAGLMSPEDGYQVAARYEEVDRVAKELGATLNAPFMTLSFLALLVIPSLKISDRGLFDGSRFSFTSVYAERG